MKRNGWSGSYSAAEYREVKWGWGVKWSEGEWGPHICKTYIWVRLAFVAGVCREDGEGKVDR